MASKKKITTAVTAVTLAVAMAVGGTFAWQSISQTALNEASDVINPGGRLHDDFNGTNKDVYVENFADDPIYARVRLEEYFEITMNPGAGTAEKKDVIIGTYDAATDTRGYEIFTKYDSLNGNTLAAGVVGDTYSENATEGTDGYSWWSWQTGGQTTYMPTFNMNKDSLQADINGTYEGPDGIAGVNPETGADDKYTDYDEYADGETLDGTEIYDADSNDIEDENVTEVAATHTAKATGDATLISMDAWSALPEEEQVGPYWVYDTDGWCYWAQAIAPDTATGLLLDGIELNQVMDDSWYYAINVVGQFITADDLGKTDNTGFYDTTDGKSKAPSANALALLKAIGVEVPITTQEELQDAFNAGGEITLGDTEITLDEAPATEVYPTIDSMLLMHEGGTLNGGTLTSTEWTDSTLFVNNENGWPATEDGSAAATVNDTTVNAATSWGIRVQALDAPATLNNVTINGTYGGLIAEYSQASGAIGGSNIITLNNMNINAESNYPHAGYEWINSAVAAAMGADVEINGGTYTGDNAVLILSSGAKVTINSGTFNGNIGYATDVLDAVKNASSIVIYGGTFDREPSSEFVADGYEAVSNDDGTWTVQPESTDGGSEDLLNYTIDITNSDYINPNEPILASDGSNNLLLNLYDEENTEVSDVKWETDSQSLVISDTNKVTATSITDALEKHTVTAYDSSDNELASIDIYVYNTETYDCIGVVASENTSAKYYAFDYVPYVGEGSLGLDPTQICVYRVGDDLSNVYYYIETMNFNINEMGTSFDEKYAADPIEMPLVSSIGEWPVRSE
ncbi:MAG: hypothetical protein IJB73_04980 [Firmicutes bacterium]|nr:hypothetical protein [Bacillota bacterium]